MKLNTILAVSAVALMSACGGGGGSVSEVQPITNFPDGRSYARFESNDYNAVVLVKDPSFDPNNLVDVIILETISANRRSDGAYEGTYRVRLANGTTATVSGVFYSETDARVFTVSDSFNRVRASVVDGTEIQSLPSGTFNYAGYAVFEYAWASAENGFWQESGTFDMTANFQNNSASINANSSTGYVTYTANGMTIDPSDGQITGPVGSYIIRDNNLTTVSSDAVAFYGNLHGDNAEYVSGSAYRYLNDSDYQLMGVVGTR